LSGTTGEPSRRRNAVFYQAHLACAERFAQVAMLDKSSITAASLIRDLEKLRGRRCDECAAPLCSHESLMNAAMGFKASPRCLKCLAAQLHRGADELRDYLFAYFQGRHCFREAWLWANRVENVAPGTMPPCLWRETEPARRAAAPCQPCDAPTGQPGGTPAQPHTASWDAGQMGCGDLILELRLRMQQMKAGEILKLTTRDPGAPEDLPSWCRLTGNTLLKAEPPDYWIRKL
jgi:tRNA 2-thiouridine synthesizing protein A